MSKDKEISPSKKYFVSYTFLVNGQVTFGDVLLHAICNQCLILSI